MKIIKIILTTKVIMIIITIITITIIAKCRGRYKTPTTTNMELFMALYNGQKFLTNIKKSSTSDAVRVLYRPLKRLIHHLTWWIEVVYAAWIICLELSPIWFLKNTCNGNINQYNNNNNSNNDCNNNNNNSNNIIIRLK